MECLGEIGGSRRKVSFLRRLLRIRKPRTQQFHSFDKTDWRERLDSVLAQLHLTVAETADVPEWIAEKQLEAIGFILSQCSSVILNSRASQAAFPFSVKSVNDKMIVAVGDLAKESQTRHIYQGEPPDRITVAMYIDGGDDATNNVIAYADVLVEALGYGEPTDEHIERGSIFRRYLAVMRADLSSGDVRDRRTKAERAIEAIGTGEHQRDDEVASAVSGLITSFKEVSRACVRVGPILFVKYTSGTEPIILVRTLSQIEISAMERLPEIQSDPVKVFQALALAINEAGNSSDV